MTFQEFMHLVRRYGIECTAGGAGYTHDDSIELFEEIEREVKILMSKSSDALKVVCPRCHAQPDERCKTRIGGNPIAKPHRARLKAAGLV